MRNRFQVLSESHIEEQEINEQWTEITEIVRESVKQKLGLLKKTKSKPWFDDECRKLIEKKERLESSGKRTKK